jgi:hypothetical protein
MQKYSGETRILVATDCIIFGFDGFKIKLLLVQRGLEPEKNLQNRLMMPLTVYWNYVQGLKTYTWSSFMYLATLIAIR